MDTTSAQIHLAVNHLPVFAALFAIAVLAWAAARRRRDARLLGLGLVVFAAVSALPAYLSGEGAEEIVEDRLGVSEALIERHEDAAAQALVGLLIAGGIAAIGLAALRGRNEALGHALAMLSLLVLLIASALLVRAAHLGGQIRHDEIRAATATRIERGGSDDD